MLEPDREAGFESHGWNAAAVAEEPEGTACRAFVPAASRERTPMRMTDDRRRLLHWSGVAISLAIVGLAIFVVVHTVSQISLSELNTAIRDTSAEQIGLAIGFAALSYLSLTGYDALGLRHLREKVAYRITALASFTSFAISFNLGFPLITGGTVRYWIYSQHAVGTGNIARLTLIAGISFWLGMGIVLGTGLTFQAADIARLNHLHVWLNTLMGVGVFGMIAGYLLWTAPRRRKVRMKGFAVELPRLGITLGQTVLGVIDVCAGAAVLYVLLPSGHDVDFISFAAIYSFAAIIGIASHSPGGLGVFEATMLNAIPAPTGQVLASLLLFRIIYYLVPFVLALALLGANESVRRWRSLRESMERDAGAGN